MCPQSFRQRMAVRAVPHARPASAPDIAVRALGPADHARYLDFVRALDPEDLYQRAMGTVAPVTDDDVRRLLAADGRRHLALAAVDRRAHGAIRGVAQAFVEPGGERAEFALIVDSRLKRRGLGRALVGALVDRLHAIGVRHVEGRTFAHNAPLIGLARGLGFALEPGDEASTRRVVRRFHQQQARP